jgi:DDE superfamily endonuclease
VFLPSQIECCSEAEAAQDYSGRKYGYSITTMIICDHNRRIRHYLSGFPGSAHDNSRVYKATKLATNPKKFFSEREYCIGDSAFENSPHMVSIEATIIVHNMLLEISEQEHQEWIDEDDFSDLDDAERAPYNDGDALNTAIPTGALKDKRPTRLESIN